jgi:cytochrome b
MTDSNALSARPASRRVVDDVTRLLHALLALSVAVAWFTSEAEGWGAVHVTAGYLAAGALAVRLVWGVRGPRAAAWSALGRRVMALGRQRSQPAWQGLAIAAMLGLVLVAAFTGVVRDWVWSDALNEVHEFAGNTVLFAVLAHLGLVVYGTLALRQHRLRAMLTGRQPGAGPDATPAWRRTALLLLAAAVAFIGWQRVAGDRRLGHQAIEQAEAHEDHPHQGDDAAAAPAERR